MKIAFMLIAPDISGGVLVLYQHAVNLTKLGMEVTFITPVEFSDERKRWFPEAINLNWKTFDQAKDIEYDIALATWWETAFDLYKVKAKKYAYFTQSVESRFYPEEQVAKRKYAESSYALGLACITEATWIKDYLKENFDRNAYLVRNGIHKNIFTVNGDSHAKREKGKLRVLIEGPLEFFPFKNVGKAISLARKSKADEVWLMTSSKCESYPGVDRVFSKVPFAETSKVYRSCDVIVKLSYIEGMFGPPLEMFHCGGTAIVYDVTGHDEYIKHNYNAFVVKKDDDEKVIEYLNILKENTAELDRLKKGALETANKWHDWDKASATLKSSLDSILASDHTYSQQEILAYSKFYRDWYEKQLSLENYYNLMNNSLFMKIKNIMKNIPFVGFITRKGINFLKRNASK